MKLRIYAFLLFLTSSVMFLSCEESGNVGEQLVIDRNQVTSDTFFIPPMQSVQYDPYTGDLNFISAGSYNDQYVGNIDVAGFFIPSLLQSTLIDTLNEKSRAFLRFRVYDYYGDTLGTAKFGVYGVRSLWRPSKFRASSVPVLDQTPLATFDVSNDTLVNVALSAKWLEEYKKYVYSDAANKDSAYIQSYYGLAIKPILPGKIFSVNRDSLKIFFYNEKDTSSVSVRSTAYNFKRVRKNNSSSSVQISSNQENLPSFTIQIDLNKLKNTNITRAMLRFEEEEGFLKNSLPKNHIRPQSLTLNAYNPNGLLKPEDIIVLSPAITFVVQTDGSYQANVTGLIRQMIASNQNQKTYYLSVQPRSGLLHNTMIDQGNLRKPKLILSVVRRDGL
jgi:hypothetical protein